ncbi:MAG: hypothetical protein ABR956_03550 [Terracidiphilus sp.]
MSTPIPSDFDESKGGRAAMAFWALAVMFAGAVQTHAQEMKPHVYKDPGGIYSVVVPAGWTTKTKPGSPMVSLENAPTKVSVTLGVIRGPEANTPTPEMELGGIKSQFSHTCPQAKTLDHGATQMAGLTGLFLLISCADPSGPETMRFAVATRPGVVAMLTVTSPGANYQKVLPQLKTIEESLKLLPGAATQGSGGAGGQFPTPTISGPGLYRDPQGRYSVKIPAGWKATSDASGTAQLTRSSSSAKIIATGGNKPLEVNHQIIQQTQGAYKAFQLQNEGDLEIGGHAAHGSNSSAINQDGVQVSVLVVTISAGGGNFLTIVSSSPNAQAKEINSQVMEMAKSVQF